MGESFTHNSESGLGVEAKGLLKSIRQRPAPIRQTFFGKFAHYVPAAPFPTASLWSARKVPATAELSRLVQCATLSGFMPSGFAHGDLADHALEFPAAREFEPLQEFHIHAYRRLEELFHHLAKSRGRVRKPSTIGNDPDHNVVKRLLNRLVLVMATDA